MMNSISGKRTLVFVSTVILLLLWELAAFIVQKEIIIPSLSLIGKELLLILTSPDSWLIILTTLGRIMFTFLMSLLLAFLLGVPAGLWKPLESLLKPIETTVRSVPTMGVILLALIWLDTEGTPLFVTSLIIFPVLYRSILDGIRNIDPALVEFHRVHRVPFLKRLRFFYIPSILPSVRTGCVSGLGLGFKVMIAAEVLSQPDTAIGTAFQIERARLNTAAVISWSVILILLASLFENILKRLGTTRRRIP